jgi:tetratricopeptide (TPR) repeat protein
MSPVRWILVLVCFTLLACDGGTPPDESSKGASEEPSAEASAPRLLEKLGDWSHPITTTSPLAQQYFDQALILTFGFNHEAAIRSFEEAARLDPKCAMCRWGVAFALGPNINAAMGPEASERAYRELQLALGLREHASPRERAYIDALATRYVSPPPEDRSELDLAFANAMRVLHESDPADLDAATLFAESLMDLYPWAYWTAEKEPREYTLEALAALEKVIETHPDHVGANHLYIHAVEEHFPERAVPSAERLGSLAPDAGHLVHMPSHIFWRVGRYGEAAAINQLAIAADEQYFGWCRPGPFYSAAYYPHNVHFLWASASFEGQSDLALTNARKLSSVTRDAVDEAPFVQEFMAVPILTLVRFGRWDQALAEPKPDPAHVYVMGTWHYARGLAFVRTGKLDEAWQALEQVRAIAATDEAAALGLASNTSTARDLLNIGSYHLEGEIAAAEDRSDDAIRALETAVSWHQQLVYMEPPPWYAPPRLALGAVLLDQGRAAEAQAVFLADLEQYPKNGWSYLGLSQSLAAQGKEGESEWARGEYETAWKNADVQLAKARF